MIFILLTDSSLSETFTENIRLKCEGKHKQTLASSGDWKYASSRKRKRPSGVLSEPAVDIEQEQYVDYSTSDDDYEPDPGFGDAVSSDLSVYTVVDSEESAGGSTSIAESTASQTPPSTGRTPPPITDVTTTDSNVWHQHAAPNVPIMLPPIAPRSMLVKQTNRAVATLPPAVQRSPAWIAYSNLSLSAPHTLRTPGPGASYKAPQPMRNSKPCIPSLGDQTIKSAAPLPISRPGTSRGYPVFPMYDQQSCPSRADYASANLAHSQGAFQPYGYQTETAPIGSVRKSSRPSVDR